MGSKQGSELEYKEQLQYLGKYDWKSHMDIRQTDGMNMFATAAMCRPLQCPYTLMYLLHIYKFDFFKVQHLFISRP